MIAQKYVVTLIIEASAPLTGIDWSNFSPILVLLISKKFRFVDFLERFITNQLPNQE